MSIAEAAELLGISKDAVRMRIRRGTLQSEKTEGRVCVFVDTEGYGDLHGDLHGDDTRPEVEASSLVDELRDRVRFLEGQLDVRTEELKEHRRIIAGLIERVPELEARESPETAVEESEPHPDAPGSQEGAQRPWWRRMFGG